MAETIELDSAQALLDLRTFVQRAEQSSDGVVRFRSSDATVRVTVCTFAPLGILDSAPTVLGMRIFRTPSHETRDLLLSGRALLDRFARLEPEASAIEIPPTRETAPWAGRDVPQNDWQRGEDLEVAMLNGIALAGIAEVADALPDNPGELLVREIRDHVWNRELAGTATLTAAVAFTGHVLGFFSKDSVATVYRSGRWTRVSTSVGHVLVFRRD